MEGKVVNDLINDWKVRDEMLCDSPEYKEYLFRRAPFNLKLFKERIMMRALVDPEFTFEWSSICDDFTKKFIVLAAPRNHGKSEHFSVDFPLKEILRDRNIRIVIVSNTASQADAFVRTIVMNIEGNSRLIDIFGNLKGEKPEKWTDNQIIVQRVATYKDPTVCGVGVGGPILSKRADLIICDDLLNIENTRTIEQRRKIKDWFYEVLRPVLNPNGRIVFIGTLWHKEDLLSELLKSPEPDYKKVYKAIISDSKSEKWNEYIKISQNNEDEKRSETAKIFLDTNKTEMMEGVKVLWPERFPYEKLILLRTAKKISFEKSYQNNILGKEEQVFTVASLEKAKKAGASYKLLRSIVIPNLKAVVQGVDLAVGFKEENDDNSLLTLGLLPDDKFIILNIEVGKWKPQDRKNIIKEQSQSFKPIQIKVETNGYQETLKMELEDENIPVAGMRTGANKWDDDLGVSGLAILLDNGRFILPYDTSDPRTVSLIDRLVDEMREFPSGHTGDVLMSLWFAYCAMRELLENSDNGFLQWCREQRNNENKPSDTPTSLKDWVKLANEQRLKL